ncbi:carbohydrate kinase family protein [Pelolinea submarina]|uniref:Ribokinase/fructoselysine 6-kinase n=1 Tax=Pelolinea submarina TaxID=913107 RepID=A0A347ZQK8_9CHLR|nr:carbohydrate kinase family protein [Pelolinea submarina]REG11855.1 ribokinase/fructoselysine 6-kinase [Pelolinea submarina]BBB47589.1 hypothetical protein Pelsub_P0816 [Pelolinea submarina]
MKVLCVGMMVCDILISPVPDDIMEKDCAKIDSPVISSGGDALNVAVSLSKLGLDASISGRIGADANGEFLLAECDKSGIDTSGVIKDTQYNTAVTYVLIDTSGERHFLTENEIFQNLKFEDIDQQQVAESDLVYFGSAMKMAAMDDGGTARLFQLAHALGKTTVMDAAVNSELSEIDWLARLSPSLQETDIFFPSYSEAKLISHKEEPGEIAACFKDFGMQIFGIKLGQNGCYVTDFQVEKLIPGVKGLPVFDTTGAGDSFMAGMICALSHDFDIFESTRFANVVAAMNIGAIGATAGVPDFDTAQQFLKRNL